MTFERATVPGQALIYGAIWSEFETPRGGGCPAENICGFAGEKVRPHLCPLLGGLSLPTF